MRKSPLSSAGWFLLGILVLCCGGSCALDAAGIIDFEEIQEEFVREMTTDAPKGAESPKAK